MNAGLRNPRRSAMIAGAMLAVGVAGVLWGTFEMYRREWTETTATGVAIGVGLLLALIGLFFLINFVWAVRLTEAMKRGENVIARWTVPQQTLEEFRAEELERIKAGRPNDYRLPRRIPSEGLEVIFSPDAVMIGDTFFGLSRSGLARFSSVQFIPGHTQTIGFGMALTYGRHTSTGGAHLTTFHSELRIPIAHTAAAEAGKVLAHYTAVGQGKVQVKPQFWSWRIKVGLWAAVIGTASVLIGLALGSWTAVPGDFSAGMAIVGAVVAPFGLILAFLAWRIREGEKRAR